MSTPSAAKALRESFGDRKLPGISRKITACVACRKLKIKCHMNDDRPPCTRCKARGLSCTVNKSLQALLESDVTWKEIIEQRLSKVEEILQQNPTAYSASNAAESATVDTPSSRKTNDRVTLNLSGSLGAFPASSLMDVAFSDDRTAYEPDLISRGNISLEPAKDLFAFYKQHLDPRIHYVLGDTDNLAAVRARSSLLTAAICTVGAFCTGHRDYQSCAKAFTNEVSRKLFSDKYEFDDVRGLCVGAFFLNDVSSALNGLAVRIGTQLDLHRCITKMPHTKRECYDRTRLYFLVYLCDHHCSLVYGRPPMTTEFRSLKRPVAFVQSKFSTPVDLALISQVEFWSLNRKVFDLFGSDIQSEIVSQRFIELKRRNEDFDQWYQAWLDYLNLRDTTDSLDRRIFDFYFHSAKLYLFSHVFRGPSEAESPAGMKVTDNLAADAAQSALSILRCAVDGTQDQSWLEKLPYYFGTMIAFASVCLIRTTLQQASPDSSEANETLQLLRQVAEVLQKSPITESSTHPLLSIAKSLEAAISERHPTSSVNANFDQFNSDAMPDLSFDFDLFASDPLNLTFPGGEDNWMWCPDQMPEMVL